MAHNYLRHRIGGAGFHEEISSDSQALAMAFTGMGVQSPSAEPIFTPTL